MKFILRIINILAQPKNEWLKIEGESALPRSLFVGYLLPLIAISILPRLLLITFAAKSFYPFYYRLLLIDLLVPVIWLFLSMYIADLLAAAFQAPRNINKSAQWVAYASTPVFIAVFFSVFPYLSGLITIGGWLYFFYLLYLGFITLEGMVYRKRVLYVVVFFFMSCLLYYILTALIISVFSVLFMFWR